MFLITKKKKKKACFIILLFLGFSVNKLFTEPKKNYSHRGFWQVRHNSFAHNA